MKIKDQVLSVFKAFHVIVEREFEQKLKVFKTDNGREYKGKFEQYCKSRVGLSSIEYTVPKKPELNGLVERMDKTITESEKHVVTC